MKSRLKKISMHPEKEVQVLCSYLVAQPASSRVIELYIEAVSKVATPVNSRQRNTWDKCIRNPWILPLADAAWAWSEPFHPLRHRIFILLFILETQRDYQHRFRPEKRNAFYILLVIGRLFTASCRLVAGKVVLWII